MGIIMNKSYQYKDGEYSSAADINWGANLDERYSDLLSNAEKNFSTKKMFLKCLDDALRVSLIEFCNENIEDADQKIAQDDINEIKNQNFGVEQRRREFHDVVNQH